MSLDSSPLPEFTSWPTFPFEGDFRVRAIDPPVAEEPPRQGEDPETCVQCLTADSEYVWVSARWRVRALERPTGLPVVLILESRSHMDLGDLPNLLAAELGVMTVRLERAVRSLEGVGRVQVNRWGDGSAHLHLWFLARPYGQLQLRGTFLSLWDDVLPPIPETRWRENLALIGAWLAEFGGRSLVEPPHIEWKASLNFDTIEREAATAARASARSAAEAEAELAAADPGEVTVQFEAGPPAADDGIPVQAEVPPSEGGGLGEPATASQMAAPEDGADQGPVETSGNGGVAGDHVGDLPGEDASTPAVPGSTADDGVSTPDTSVVPAAAGGATAGELVNVPALAPPASDASHPIRPVGGASASDVVGAGDASTGHGDPLVVGDPQAATSGAAQSVVAKAPRKAATRAKSGVDGADPAKPRPPRAPRKSTKKAAPPAVAAEELNDR